MSRVAKIRRFTKETQIELRINLDGQGKSAITTGIRFLDHMLDLVARHGAMDLNHSGEGRSRRGSAPHRRGRRHRPG